MLDKEYLLNLQKEIKKNGTVLDDLPEEVLDGLIDLYENQNELLDKMIEGYKKDTKNKLEKLKKINRNS